MSSQRFRLIWDGMTYKVSEPGVDSCEVVLAHVYDARVAELGQENGELRGKLVAESSEHVMLAIKTNKMEQQLATVTAELEQAETERIEWVQRAERAEKVNDELRAELARREAELEAYAWTISPAMAQARIDELNAKVEHLTAELARVQKSYDADLEHWSNLAAIQTLTWTTARPTVAGWYWWRETPKKEHEEICRVTGNNILTAHFDYSRTESVFSLTGEWAGPIPMPQEEA